MIGATGAGEGESAQRVDGVANVLHQLLQIVNVAYVKDAGKLQD